MLQKKQDGLVVSASATETEAKIITIALVIFLTLVALVIISKQHFQ